LSQCISLKCFVRVLAWHYGLAQVSHLAFQLLFSNTYGSISVVKQDVNCYLAIKSMRIKKSFDGEAFYRALEATVKARGVTWKQLAERTQVSPTTLARMATGRKPDAASVAALSAWAGLNLADFVFMVDRPKRPETMAVLGTTLRADPALDPRSVEALESIFRAAYLSMRRKPD
jgi:transcriptional regulator with XRE-family HTH domain